MTKNTEKGLVYKTAYLFDVARQGVYYEKIKIEDDDFRNQTALKITGEPYHTLRRSHFVSSEESFFEIENLLKNNASKGRAGEVLFVLGFRSDAFSVYKEKFENTKKLLKLFHKYKPGKLLIQTFSHLCVLSLTELLSLKDIITLNICIETFDDEILSKFSPSNSTLNDRLKACSAMKTFGFDVEVQVAPILPYSGGEDTANAFAQKLSKSANRIFVKSYASMTGEDKQKKQSPLALKLASEGFGEWLRDENIEIELVDAINSINSKLLEKPTVYKGESKQLSLFVA
jgi:hypothetical protein